MGLRRAVRTAVSTGLTLGPLGQGSGRRRLGFVPEQLVGDLDAKIAEALAPLRPQIEARDGRNPGSTLPSAQMSDRRPTLELTVRCDVCRKGFSLAIDPLQMVSALPEGKSTVATICPDCRGNRLNEVLAFEATAGDRVRIVIPYDDTWRHIFWFRVSRRGDIYCTFGFGDDYIDEAKTGSTRAVDGRVEVKYGEFEQDVAGKLKGGRVSFHEGGQIHLADRQIEGTPLVGRSEQAILCTMVFQHPSAFPPLDQIGDRDVILRLGVAEDRALVAALHLVPPGVEVDLASGVAEVGEPRKHVLIRFDGLDPDVGNELTLHFVLGHGPRIESWPPMSYLLVSSVSR